jgi:hypothetical protein
MEAAAPYLLSLLLGCLFAYGTGTVAARKGRNAVRWGVFGFFLGVFALLTEFLVPARRPAFD